MLETLGQPHLINLIPSAGLVDDFAVFGFIGGLVSYAWYLFTNYNDPKNHIGLLAGIYGVFLSGCLGALLAIAIDRSIALSIIVGLTNQIIYLAIIKSIKNKNFTQTFRELLIHLLTAGKK